MEFSFSVTLPIHFACHPLAIPPRVSDVHDLFTQVGRVLSDKAEQ